MNRKYRVAVWGTGVIGTGCVKQVLRAHELELVGVLVYSEAKEGKDVGPLFGLPNSGVIATRDREAIYAAKPDCILYTAKDLGKFASDDDIIEILSRGINVITSLPYHWLGRRPVAVVNAIRAAAEKGGATLHATGVMPNMMFERLTFAATGLTSDIRSIVLEEFVQSGAEPEDTLRNFGFGVPLEKSKGGPVREIAEQYFGQMLYYTADAMGTPVNELHYSGEWRVATQPVRTPTMVVQPGEVEFISHRWEARPANGPMLGYQCRWFLREETKPEGVPCEDFYIITIEARPSIRMRVELRASISEYVRMRPDDMLAPVYYATANPMLQAIPHVIAAPPGISPTLPPSNSYWKKDMRVDYVARR